MNHYTLIIMITNKCNNSSTLKLIRIFDKNKKYEKIVCLRKSNVNIVLQKLLEEKLQHMGSYSCNQRSSILKKLIYIGIIFNQKLSPKGFILE